MLIAAFVFSPLGQQTIRYLSGVGGYDLGHTRLSSPLGAVGYGRQSATLAGIEESHSSKANADDATLIEPVRLAAARGVETV